MRTRTLAADVASSTGPTEPDGSQRPRPLRRLNCMAGLSPVALQLHSKHPNLTAFLSSLRNPNLLLSGPSHRFAAARSLLFLLPPLIAAYCSAGPVSLGCLLDGLVSDRPTDSEQASIGKSAQERSRDRRLLLLATESGGSSTGACPPRSPTAPTTTRARTTDDRSSDAAPSPATRPRKTYVATVASQQLSQ